MKVNIRVAGVIIVIMALIAGNAFAGAQASPQVQHEKGSKGKDMIAQELNLSADQQSRLDQERKANLAAMDSFRSALKEKKRELQEAIAKPETTRAQVEPILNEIKKLQSDMADKRADGVFAVKAILTPEQFTKLRSIREKKMQDNKSGGKEKK